MLCPTCHRIFDTSLKPKIREALADAGVTSLPKSWEESIFDQAAKASKKALRRKKRR